MKNNQDRLSLDLNVLQSIAQEIEKFKQETEYVCLKLAIKDWATFLAQLRKGNIVKVPNNNLLNLSNSQKSPLKQYNSSTTNKSNVFQLLNEVLQVKPTKRNGCRSIVRECECESPICSQAKIKHIKGSDTSRSQSSLPDAPLFEKEEDPFQKYKIENICGTNTFDNKAIEQLLKSMEDYQKQQKQKQNQVQGFETFRKVPVQQKSFESEQERHYQNTAKKSYNNICNSMQTDSPSFQRVNSQEWIKQNIELEPGMRQFILALQNTKLRKEITHLQKKLNKNSQYI